MTSSVYIESPTNVANKMEIQSDGSLNVNVNNPVTSVNVANLPATQPVSGTVSVANFPSSQSVTGTVAVSNLPATQPVSGTVSVGNFPATQPVSGSVTVSNLPATQPVSGTVAVSNFPATQPVSGTVSVGNFPATQAVTGTLAIAPSIPVATDIVRASATATGTLFTVPAGRTFFGSASLSACVAVAGSSQPSISTPAGNIHQITINGLALVSVASANTIDNVYISGGASGTAVTFTAGASGTSTGQIAGRLL